MKKKEMSNLIGGRSDGPIDSIIKPCRCACKYADSGGSSRSDNFQANEQAYPGWGSV